MTPSRSRSSCCMIQKQPPARTAVSALSLMALPFLQNCAEDYCRGPAGLAEPPYHNAQLQAARHGHPARPVQSAGTSQMGGVTLRGTMFRSEDRKLSGLPRKFVGGAGHA